MVSTSTAPIYAFATLGIAMLTVIIYFAAIMFVFFIVAQPATLFAKAVFRILFGKIT